MTPRVSVQKIINKDKRNHYLNNLIKLLVNSYQQLIIGTTPLFL